jgi:hypothetical protein
LGAAPAGLLLPEARDPNSHQNIEVWTTLDPKLQTAAAEAVHANAPKDAQGALVSLDRDGAVLAMVGGWITSPAITTAPPTPCASRVRRGSCSFIWPRWNRA